MVLCRGAIVVCAAGLTSASADTTSGTRRQRRIVSTGLAHIKREAIAADSSDGITPGVVDQKGLTISVL